MAKILVVDDEVGIVELLKSFLSGEGFQVEGATSDNEALTKLQTNPPDLVLLDVKLGPGEISGIEVLQRLRDQGSQIKVIMMSGSTAEDYWPQAEKLGAAGRFYKPLDLVKLSEVIKKTLESHDGACPQK
jgi:DNA-binding response OmpR family regulator